MARSRHPQAGLMFAKLAAHHSDNLGTVEDEFYDFSNPMNFWALATCLQEFIDPEIEPSFEEPLRPDQAVQHVFALQLMNETNLHQAACMRAGLRRSWYDVDQDYGELRLTKAPPTLRSHAGRRTGAGRSLANHNGFEGRSNGAVGGRRLLRIRKREGAFEVRLRGQPAVVGELEKATGVSTELLTGFSGFLVFLEFAAREVGHSLAYTDENEALAGISSSHSRMRRLMLITSCHSPNNSA